MAAEIVVLWAAQPMGKIALATRIDNNNNKI